MSEDLDGILNDVEPVAPVETETGEPEKAKAVAEVAEKADEATKEETPASRESDVDTQWTKAMALDERSKRQAAVKELEDFKAQSEAKVETPDVFDDQEGFVASIRTEFDSKLNNQRIELSRNFMMDAHDDYEAKEAVFLDLAKDNQALKAEALNSPNPAKFVYEQATKHQQYQEMQDVDGFREKLKAELRAELEAESKESKKAEAENVVSITPSLATARASDSNAVVDDSLSAALGE